MKAAQRDKSLYAKLKAVSDLRKQAWLDKVTAATASITSPNGAAYKAWADENTTLTGLESTLATALTNKNTAVTAFTTAATEYTAAQALTAAWLAAKGTAATVKTRADGVATTLTAAVGTLTTAVGDAASGLTKAKTTAGTEYTAADTALTAAKTAATASEAALTTPLSERATALAAVTTAEAAVAAEWAKITTNTQELDAGIADLATKEAALLAAEVACKAAQYDAFKTALTTAEAERTAKLATIKNLVESAPVYALGATNGRCEKPMTNGDWAKRGKCANAEADCCGAARGVGPSGATMTIEVCQPKASQAYMWQPPRAPMATTWPAKVSWDFVCIGGATQLAGAAAALLASAYMMA